MSRYYRDPSFESTRRGNKLYLRHRESGDCVSVDDVLFCLWNALEGQTPAELFLQLGEEIGLSPALLETVLAILVRAGLVRSDEPTSIKSEPTPAVEGPLVSVVVLNMDGVQHLEACLSSLADQSYQNLEVILVDNGSRDDSVAFVGQRFPWVQVLALGENRGFSEGNNAGFRAAKGKYAFVLNNDTEVAADCIAEMVQVAERDECIAAVAPMIKLYYLRGFLNGLGNVIGPVGWGSDRYAGHLDLGQFGAAQEIFSACFGAALIRCSAFEQIGMLDPGFHLFYYEDGDWCYRARLVGYKVYAAPRAVVYHKFSATMNTRPSTFKLSLLVRNRLRYAVKNLRVGRALLFGASYLAEDAYHVLRALLRGDGPTIAGTVQGWLGFAKSVPDVLRHRTQVQRMRVRGMTDQRLFALTRHTPPPQLDDNVPLLTLRDVQEHYLRVAPHLRKRRVAVVSPDVVNSSMAGPGVRCWELSRELALDFEVTLAVPGACDLTGEGFEIVRYQVGKDQSLTKAIADADVIVVSGYVLHQFPSLRDARVPLVVDLYDPFIIENLHFHARKPLPDQAAIHRNDLAVLNDQLQAGDFFLCASEKQRDYCIGLLMANNRINPATWVGDRTLRALIDVVPFGLRSRSPQAQQPVLKGVHPGIRADDQVILWGGGVWEWVDPLTAIRAMPRVVASCPRAKLFFIGIRHPNPAVPQSDMARQAVELSRELGLMDRCVLFNEWTPYAEREGYLLEADVGISLHFDHLETRFAFRTRLLDYIWAGLPIVTSGGDALGEIVAQEGLGAVVDSEDVSGVAEALIALLSEPDAKARLSDRFSRVAESYAWERVAEPLVSFCRQPQFATDRRGGTAAQVEVLTTPEPTPVWRLPIRAWHILRQDGVGGVWKEALSYLRWLMIRL